MGNINDHAERAQTNLQTKCLEKSTNDRPAPSGASASTDAHAESIAYLQSLPAEWLTVFQHYWRFMGRNFGALWESQWSGSIHMRQWAEILNDAGITSREIADGVRAIKSRWCKDRPEGKCYPPSPIEFVQLCKSRRPAVPETPALPKSTLPLEDRKARLAALREKAGV